MPTNDYLPRNWAAFAEWMMNFYTQLQVLATKYGVTQQTLDQTEIDNDWVQYWVQAKFNAKLQEKQLHEFVETIADGDIAKPTPNIPTWSLPPNPPAATTTGIKKRIREIAAEIKAQKSIYTLSDGTLLGIVSGEETGKPESEYAPALKIEPMTAYHLGFEFRKEGLDAVRFQYRHKGGEWQALGDSAKSPTDFMVTPATPGEAEQIEIRAVFLKDYKPFGSFSPSYTATIAP